MDTIIKGQELTFMLNIQGNLVQNDFIFLGKSITFKGTEYFQFQSLTKNPYLMSMDRNAIKDALPSEAVACEEITGL